MPGNAVRNYRVHDYQKAQSIALRLIANGGDDTTVYKVLADMKKFENDTIWEIIKWCRDQITDIARIMRKMPVQGRHAVLVVDKDDIPKFIQ